MKPSVFGALDHPERLHIVKKLASGPMTAGELYGVRSVDMTQGMHSKHLTILHEAGLVKKSKRAQWVTYTLMKENVRAAFTEVMEMIDAYVEVIDGD